MVLYYFLTKNPSPRRVEAIHRYFAGPRVHAIMRALFQYTSIMSARGDLDNDYGRFILHGLGHLDFILLDYTKRLHEKSEAMSADEKRSLSRKIFPNIAWVLQQNLCSTFGVGFHR